MFVPKNRKSADKQQDPVYVQGGLCLHQLMGQSQDRAGAQGMAGFQWLHMVTLFLQPEVGMQWGITLRMKPFSLSHWKRPEEHGLWWPGKKNGTHGVIDIECTVCYVKLTQQLQCSSCERSMLQSNPHFLMVNTIGQWFPNVLALRHT